MASDNVIHCVNWSMMSCMMIISPLLVSEFFIEYNASLTPNPALCATASNLKKFVFCFSFGAKNFLMINFSKNHNLLIVILQYTTKW